MTHGALLRATTTRVAITGILVTLTWPVCAQDTQPSPAVVLIEPSVKTEPSVTLDTGGRPEPAPKTEVSAPSASTVEAFIARLDSATRAIREKSNDSAAMREGCHALLNELLDLNVMTRATNSEIWDQLTPTQQNLLRAAFEQRMVSACMRQFANYEGDSMQLAGIKSAPGGETLATVRLGTRDDGKLVTWKLQHTSSPMLRAIDVIAEGRSAVSDARTEFAAVLQSANGDIEALIAFMQK
jgi:ABC-type transporter MlaC component